jgi:phage portal protein BeeE
LRGDIKSRYEAYQIAIQNGWNNRDEIREMENQNPIPGGLGQKYTANAATVPLDQLGELKGGENNG